MLIGLLGIALLSNAQDYEGTYQLQLETDAGNLPYEIRLVTAKDGAIFGGITALSDTLYYKMPLQLARQTEDSLYFNIWRKVRIKVDRTQSPMRGLARITRDKRVYPVTLAKQSGKVDKGWAITKTLLPLDLGVDEVSWPTPASNHSFYYTHDRKIWLAEWSPVGYRSKLLAYDTASYDFFSIGLSPDEKTLLAHGVPRDKRLPELGGGDIYELHLRSETEIDSIRLLPPPVNCPTYDIFPAYTANGDLLLTSYGKLGEADSAGRADLYIARSEGSGFTTTAFPPHINTPAAEAGAFMDRQGRFLLFHRNSRKPPRFSDKIFISRREADGWAQPQPLSEVVNNALGGWAPRISQDGRYLYFNSAFRGQRHIYRVKTSEVPALAPYFSEPAPLDGTYELSTSDGRSYDIQLVTAEDEVIYGTLKRNSDTAFYHAPVYVSHYAPDSLQLISWYGDRNLSFSHVNGVWQGGGNPEGETVGLSLNKRSDTVQAGLQASASLQPIPVPTRAPAFTAHKEDGRMYVIGWASGDIYLMEERAGKWAKAPVPYDRERYRFSSLGLSPGERTLVAHGRRVDQDNPNAGSLYLLHLKTDTSVASIEQLPESVNTSTHDNFPDYTATGDIVFSSWGDAAGTPGAGSGDLYRAQRAGESYITEPLSTVLNTGQPDAGPSLSADGRVVLFHRSRQSPPMKDKIYLSYKADGEWAEATPLPAPVNIEHSGQYGPRLNADETFLYWTSHHRGEGGLYRLPVNSIPALNNALKTR